jgi:hypothetical protein
MENGGCTHYVSRHVTERNGDIRLLRGKEENFMNLGNKKGYLLFGNCSHLFLSGLKNVVYFAAVPTS